MRVSDEVIECLLRSNPGGEKWKLAADLRDARARLAALEAQAGAQRAALLRLEWTLGPEGDGLCPACEGMESVSDHSPEPPGHAPDCFLAAALGEEAQTDDDEAHRRAWDRYMAAKRKMVEAREP